MYEVWARRIMLDVLRDIVLMRRLSILFIVCFTILLFIKKKEREVVWAGYTVRLRYLFVVCL